jgi:hypothetical protein
LALRFSVMCTPKQSSGLKFANAGPAFAPAPQTHVYVVRTREGGGGLSRATCANPIPRESFRIKEGR